MEKRSPSPKKQIRSAGPVSRRADQLSKDSAIPDEPTVHHWLKAEAELSWKRDRTSKHQIRIGP